MINDKSVDQAVNKQKRSGIVVCLLVAVLSRLEEA